MENKMNDKFLYKTEKKLQSYVQKDILNFFALTNSFGYDTKDHKRFFDGARVAAEKNKWQIEKIGKKAVYWIPLSWNKKPVAVCGLLGYKEYPKEKAKVLTGLLDEVAYEEFLETQLENTIHPKSNFVKGLLLSKDIKTFDEAIERADIIGVNLRSPQAVIVFEVPEFFKKAYKKHQKLSKEKQMVEIANECRELMSKLSAAFSNYEQNVFACLGEDLFACLKWAKGEVNTLNTIKFFREKADYIQEVVKKETGIIPTIGVGQYYPGLSGLRKSYEDAEVALLIGKKIWGEGKSYHIIDVGMFVMLSPEVSFERKCELAMQILGPVFSDRDIYKTVSAFLENDMNLSDTAKKMHLHRNTLIYRLDKVKKTIGLDPRKFSDAVQIKLGLLLYKPEEKCEKD